MSHAHRECGVIRTGVIVHDMRKAGEVDDLSEAIDHDMCKTWGGRWLHVRVVQRLKGKGDLREFAGSRMAIKGNLRVKR